MNLKQQILCQILMKKFFSSVYSNHISCDYIIISSLIFGIYSKMINWSIKVDITHKIEVNILKCVKQNLKRGNIIRKSNIY